MDRYYDEKVSKFIEDHFDEFIRDWQTIIRIPSLSAPSAGDKVYGEACAQALDTMLGIAQGYGFETKNLDWYCGYAQMGESEETVAAFAHLDIVPFGDGWTVDPLGADVIDGNMYGRGSDDNKVACIGGLFALRALREAGVPLKRKVRIVFGCEEESGMTDMVHYLQEEGEPTYGLVPDADVPVNHAEKGIIRGQLGYRIVAPTLLKQLQGGERCNIVPGEVTALLDVQADAIPAELQGVTWEKTAEGIRLTAHGKTCHAAFPDAGQNGIGLMAMALAHILPEEDGAYPMIRMIADRIGLNQYGEQLGIARQDNTTGRLTFNIGIIALEEDILHFVYDIRNPSTLSCEQTADELCAVLKPIGIFEMERHISPPMYLPLEHPLVRTVRDTYNSLTSQDLQPTTMGGGTYARKFKTAVACGMANGSGAHTSDEHVDIESAKQGCRIFANILANVANL